MNYAWFEKNAPHLAASPLVLIGFAHGIHGQLMKSRLLRQVNQKLMPPCYVGASRHACIEDRSMPALRFPPCWHGAEAACCAAGFSLLTWEDVRCKLAGQDVAISDCRICSSV